MDESFIILLFGKLDELEIQSVIGLSIFPKTIFWLFYDFFHDLPTVMLKEQCVDAQSSGCISGLP